MRRHGQAAIGAEVSQSLIRLSCGDNGLCFRSRKIVGNDDLDVFPCDGETIGQGILQQIRSISRGNDYRELKHSPTNATRVGLCIALFAARSAAIESSGSCINTMLE